MPVVQEELEGSSMSAEHGEEDQDEASSEQHLERRTLVLQFLHSTLNLHHLQSHQRKVELLKKCYFYLEVEPKYMAVREQQQDPHFIDIFELIDPWQFQRMKEVGRNQIEIQLALLSELLEQLERGQKELRAYTDSCDSSPFLSGWDLVVQRMSALAQFMQQLMALQTPEKVYVRHCLVSPLEAQRRGATLPDIRLSLSTKLPLIFDREASVADTKWVRLKWSSEDPASYPEQYEVYVKLLTNGMERGFSRIQLVNTNIFVVQGLEPGRLYEFTVLRPATQTLVFQNWHDTITLRTGT
ncbi:fibronectin type III domain-containing protein 11 [Indicator indicator]|uniref:fibronectin type III domain-containing protein 11 n=1 Tax=Indicator indicator TaxID=1002788 RepID=UPI0023E0072A|nr:fibronectin type III domain-containing protein 11 [Indicator indicator]